MALKAREAAIRLLSDRIPTRAHRHEREDPRVLECDREAADQLRAEMGLLRERLASTRQMMNDYRAGAGTTAPRQPRPGAGPMRARADGWPAPCGPASSSGRTRLAGTPGAAQRFCRSVPDTARLATPARGVET